MVGQSPSHGFMGQFQSAVRQIEKWLHDDSVTEIMVNPSGEVWIDQLGKDMENTGVKMAPNTAATIVSLVASWTKTTVSADNPIVSAELPDGSRFEGLIPPVVATPSFSIRRHTSMVLTLDDYVNKGTITPEQKELFEKAVLDRENILVVGGTGSGKTTFSNALVHSISVLTPDHRVITIEDTRELKISSPNVVNLRTSDTIDMTRLLKSCMRLRPDRILVGEVRGPEALALLKAWNTGHPGGVATVHANNALSGLTRLEQLVQEAGIPDHAARPIIAEAVNIVVFIEKTKTGRKISEIRKMICYNGNNYETIVV